MTIQDTAVVVADGDQLDDGYFNGISGVRDVEAGETLADGDVVFIYGSGHANEGEAWLSDADVQDKNRANGIVVGAGGNDGDTIQIMAGGIYVTSGLTAKETYYLSTTAGDWTTTASGVKLGQAISTTQLFINIVQDDRDAIGAIKQFVTTMAGIPTNNMTAFWQLCDGTTISDAESPLNGQTIRDLNANNELLRSADTSDMAGVGGGTHNHIWKNSNSTYDSGGGLISGFAQSDDTGTGFRVVYGTVNLYTQKVDGSAPYMDVVTAIKIK